MNLKQAIDIAEIYADLDGASVSEVLIRHYADLAQKEIAVNVSRIVKRFLITKYSKTPEIYKLPEDGTEFYRIMRRHSVLPINFVKNAWNELTLCDSGKFDIYYSVMPKTIDAATPSDYSFEVDSRCHGAIPFYIAHRIAPDKGVSKTCFNEWKKLNSMAADERRAQSRILCSGDYFL